MIIDVGENGSCHSDNPSRGIRRGMSGEKSV
jgi:hypothetical protein